MNFLQISRVSFDRVAENIITCLSCGVPRKISWTSRRISEKNCQAWPSQWSNFERHPPEILSKLYQGAMELTKGIKHFVTFIENKVFDIFQVQWSVADQSLEATWSCDDNMRWILLQCFLVLVDWHTTEKYSNLKNGSPWGSGAWIPDMDEHIPWDFPCILKIFDILLRFEKRVHECGTWPTLEGHLSCLLFLCPIVAMLLKQKRLFYPYRIWPDRQHPFR